MWMNKLIEIQKAIPDMIVSQFENPFICKIPNLLFSSSEKILNITFIYVKRIISKLTDE